MFGFCCSKRRSVAALFLGWVLEILFTSLLSYKMGEAPWLGRSMCRCAATLWWGNCWVLRHPIGVVSFVVPNVAAFVWSDVSVPRSAAPLARYRMGVASACAVASSHRKDFRFVFLAPHNCGLVDAVCFHIAWWTKLCCRFVSKVLVPVLLELELSRVPEVARLLPCNFASNRRLLVVLWRLLWISNAAGLQQCVWGCLPGCCWGRLSFKIRALWFLPCVCHCLKLWR